MSVHNDADAPGRLPALFLGHGDPMHALRENRFTEAWRSLGQSLPSPKAILVISAHWYIADMEVTSSPKPETIHDFYGFPKELYGVTYPAPGSPELAARVAGLLAPERVLASPHRGLDHGAWSILYHMFPKADVPVVQLSIDSTREPGFHFQAGRLLRPLRDEGILVLGSGNIVHNLRMYRWEERGAAPFDWAAGFEAQARKLILDGEGHRLADYRGMGDAARLSVPTPDHLLPLLFILGMQDAGEPASFPVEGFDGASISMLGVRIG